ncbi:hypothetical protein HPB50_023099 [Hyalomma asiaticum]|uniref:Uncharacterized protein n=1 Tax=Hyalomma asiaticum TaxID=266040 RepID=A0ACB7TPQ7_HYAAI|nr:hypothetical protein HPB50_023099 [Hyalomma asiaticum]
MASGEVDCLEMEWCHLSQEAAPTSSEHDCLLGNVALGYTFAKFSAVHQVRMANGVFVLKPSYYHLMWVHKDSHIVERSAAVIWFTDALAQ